MLRLCPLGLALAAGPAFAADAQVAVVGLHVDGLDLIGQRAAAADIAAAIDQAGAFDGLAAPEVAGKLRGREAIVLEESFLANGRRLFDEGRLQYEQAAFDEAIRVLTDAVAAFDAAVPAANSTRDLWEAYVYLGTALRAADRGADAEAAFRAAITLAPARNPNAAKFPPDVIAYHDSLRQKMSADVGLIRVEASVPGTRVFLNGEDKGPAPLTLSGVLPGKNYVVARAPTGEVASSVIKVAPKQAAEVKLTLAPASLPSNGADSKFAKARMIGTLYANVAKRAEVDLALIAGAVDGALSLQLYSTRSDTFTTPVVVPYTGSPTDEVLAALPKLFTGVQPDGTIASGASAANAVALDVAHDRLLASLLLGGEAPAAPAVVEKPPEDKPPPPAPERRGGAGKWVIAGVAGAAAVGAGVGVWALTQDGGGAGNQGTVVIGPLD